MTALEYVQHLFPPYAYEFTQAQQGFVHASGSLLCMWKLVIVKNTGISVIFLIYLIETFCQVTSNSKVFKCC